jgi:nuclear pore complex protein Nup98-Nup96
MRFRKVMFNCNKIYDLQVAEKPLPNRTMSMLVPRHLSQRRIKLHPRKYNPISDSKVMTCKHT